jgi:hypothetical protein
MNSPMCATALVWHYAWIEGRPVESRRVGVADEIDVQLGSRNPRATGSFAPSRWGRQAGARLARRRTKVARSGGLKRTLASWVSRAHHSGSVQIGLGPGVQAGL